MFGHDLVPAFGFAKIHKRAPTTTSTTVARTTATAARAATTVAAATSIGRSGVANTATGKALTRIAATAPPTTRTQLLNTKSLSEYSVSFAGVNSAYSAPVASGAATTRAVAGSTSGNSASSNQSFFDTEIVGLKATTFIAIVAGAGGGVILIAIVLGVWCCKRKKGKKAEREWRKLNESQKSLPGGGSAGGMKAGEIEPWAGKDEKSWEPAVASATSPFGDEKRGGGGGADGWGSEQGGQGLYQQQYPFSARDQADLAAQRQELFSSSGASRGREGEGNPFLDRQQQQQYPQQQQQQHDYRSYQPRQPPSEYPPAPASQPRELYSGALAYPPRPHPSAIPTSQSNNSLVSRSHSESPAPFASAPPRPNYDAPAASRPMSTYGAVTTRDTMDVHNDRLRDRLHGVMGGGNVEELVQEEEASWAQKSKKRQSMMGNRKKDTIMDFTGAYGDFGDDDDEQEASWSNDQAPVVAAAASAPPPRRSSSKKGNGPRPTNAPPLPATDSYFPSSTTIAPVPEDEPNPTRREPTARYSTRVDSKPLRELEDILDSFHTTKGGRPPLPADAASVRSNSTRSAKSVAPLNLGRARIGAANSSVPNSFALGGGLATPPLRSPLSEHPPTVYQTPVQHDPWKATPRRPILSTISSNPSSTPSSPEAEILRKVSIKRDGETSPAPPVLLSRADSLASSTAGGGQQQSSGRPPLQSQAERALYAQMMLDSPPDSPPSWGHSNGPSPSNSPTTPQLDAAFHHQTAPDQHHGNGGLKAPQVVVRQEVDGNGFEPLSSHSADTGYRSATLSVYGLYDDDDEPTLKGLPMNDPRVSRHLSGLYAPQPMR